MEFKLKENQTGVLPDDMIIEEHGTVFDFTLRQLKENIAYHAKAVKELSANAGLQEAIANNILKNNEDIKEIAEEKLHAIAMYYEAKKQMKVYSDKCKEFDTQLGKDNENLKKILEQFPELNEPSAVVENGEVKLVDNK